jgi:uncharacterized membrane protein YoaK (UPF0700 family)
MQGQTWLALLLAWIAGFVDAVGYLALFHLFTAHMSGNSAAFGAELGTGQTAEALRRAFPIPMFVLGIALGTGLTEIALRRGAASPFALALGLEALLLAAFMVCGSLWTRTGEIRVEMGWKFVLLTALPALTMGLQSATLRKVGRASVRTTYISGMLTDMAEEGVTYLFRLADCMQRQAGGRRGAALRASLREPALRRALLYGSIWGAFACGAVTGGYLLHLWRLWSLALPLCALTLVAVRDWLRPFGISGENPAPEKREGERNASEVAG